MSAKQEGGLRDHRPEFVRENVDADGNPETPSNPSWQRPSDRVYSVEWTPSPGLTGDRGLGDVDVDEHDKGPEEHELVVSYALQKWFVDGSGDPDDLAGDGLLRDSDGLLHNSHTFVDREDKGTLAAKSTIEGQENGKGGATAKATRIFTVAKGCKIDDVTVVVDPGDQQPARVDVTYVPEKGRRYQIDQPTATREVWVKSTNANDTSQTLTVEDEGASTTDTVSLNGTTEVQSTATFADLDVLELDAETEGDVEVYQDDGSGTASGELLAVIEGSSSYDGIEGDLGIPALGTGSHASAIGTAYQRTLTDTITLGGSSDEWFDINSKELSVSNNLDPTPRDDSLRMRITEGVRDAEMSVTTAGEVQSYMDARRALTNTGADIVWTFPDAPTGSGTITLKTAKLTDPGLGPYESQESSMSINETFVPEGGGTAGLAIA